MYQGRILLGQSAFYVLEQAAVLVGKIALGVGVARLLSPEGFGSLELALSIATLGSSLSSQWLTQAILRFAPRSGGKGARAESKGQVREAVKLVLLPALSVTSVVVAVSVRLLLGEGSGTTGLLAGLYCLMLGVFEPSLAVLQAGGFAQKHAVWAGLGRSAGVVFALALLLLFTRSVPSVLIGMTGSIAIVTRVLWSHLDDVPTKGAGLSGGTKLWLRFGLPLSAWFAAFAVLNVGDRVVLQAYSGSGAVGVYGASYRLVLAATSVLLAPLLMAGHPRILGRWHDDNEAAAVELLGTLTGTALCMGMALAGAAAVAGPTLVQLLVGDEYAVSASTLVSLAIGFLVWQLSLYSQKGLEATGATARLALFGGLAAFANILLNLALIPRLGVFGAALATAASYSAYLFAVEWIGGSLVTRNTPWQLVARGGAWILSIWISGSFLMPAPSRYLVRNLGLNPSIRSATEDVLMAGALVLAGIWRATTVLRAR